MLKSHLLEILKGTSVHCGIEAVVDDVPFELWGKKIRNLPYTLYELLEHIRLSTKDFIEYIENPDYEPTEWPEGYWPKGSSPKNEEEVQKAVKALYRDLKRMRKLIQDGNLLDPLPYGDPQHSIAREVMILSDHLAYHLGQMVLMRRLLGAWEN